MGVSVDSLGRFLSPRQVARTDEDGEVFCGQLLCDLQADPLIGPGDQGDALIWHMDLHSREGGYGQLAQPAL